MEITKPQLLEEIAAWCESRGGARKRARQVGGDEAALVFWVQDAHIIHQALDARPDRQGESIKERFQIKLETTLGVLGRIQVPFDMIYVGMTSRDDGPGRAHPQAEGAQGALQGCFWDGRGGANLPGLA